MRLFLLALAIAGCSSSPSPSDCGAIPNLKLHEDYCGVNSSMLCLYDHPEGMGF